MSNSQDTNNFDWKKNTFKVIKEYFKRDNERHLVLHQILSYNIFIQKHLHSIIYSYNPLNMNFNYLPDLKCHQYVMNLRFSNINLNRAMIHENDGSTSIMYPSDARKRIFTYASHLFVNLNESFCFDLIMSIILLAFIYIVSFYCYINLKNNIFE